MTTDTRETKSRTVEIKDDSGAVLGVMQLNVTQGKGFSIGFDFMNFSAVQQEKDAPEVLNTFIAESIERARADGMPI